MKNRGLWLVSLLGLTCLIACATSGKRYLASDGSFEGIPPGLSGQDAADFEHLSEGSDIYPYEWMMALKSVNYLDASKNITLPFYSDLDQRFGILPSRNRGSYLMDYAGLTASWSSSPGDQSDALISDRSERVRSVNGVKSIKMVGTNCVICHSSEIHFNGSAYHVEGAPNLVNIRGFFEDLAQSTIAILAKKDLMTAFLQAQGVSEPEARAKEITDLFISELGKDTSEFGIQVGDVSGILTLMLAKEGFTGRFYNGKMALSLALEKLLRVTYGLTDSDDIGELKDRMKFLGILMVGTDPKTKETKSGFARTDAFGRIGNLVLRGTNPIGYTAPVSLPWIWGIKYEALLHYTANTNSVALRNIGQSLGLGAVVLEQGGSTVNLYNLNRLEKLVHKIPVPKWETVFAGQPLLQVDYPAAERGRKIYAQNCRQCHETSEKVGPTGALYNYYVGKLADVDTDPKAATNIVVPVDQKPFEVAITQGVEKVKSDVYQRLHVDASEQAIYEFRPLRGAEFFRDTLNGYEEEEKLGNNYGNIPPGYGYKARHLAGVWATGPFLHNGSVPTIWDLLHPSRLRPKVFNVRGRNFDPKHLGFENLRQTDFVGLPKSCEKKDDTCFDTALVGNGNKGHEGRIYGTDLKDSDKLDLIEFLKVLPPEPEYAWQN